MRQKVVFFVAFAALLCLARSLQGQTLYPVQVNGVWGYINGEGTLVVSPKFDHAESMQNGVAKAKKGNSLFVIFSQNNILEFPNCTRMAWVAPNLFKVQKNNKWWFADSNGIFLTEEGYDRIWPISETTNRYYYSNEGKMGVLNDQGEVLTRSYHSNLRRYGDSFYVVLTQTRISILVNENGQIIGKDSFRKLECINHEFSLFYGTTLQHKEILFQGNGEVILEAKHMKCEALSNDFVVVTKDKKTILFDAQRMCFIDSLKGIFSSSTLPGTVQVAQAPNQNQTFDRFRGFTLPAFNVSVVTQGDPSIVSANGLYGLVNRNNVVVLDMVYGQIIKLDKQYFSVMDTGFLYRIFNAKTSKWVNDNSYTRIVKGPNYLKAYYGVANSMDHYRLNEIGDIAEVSTYYNVRLVEVQFRNANGWGWNTNINNPWAAIANTSRKTAWFSQNTMLGRNRTLMAQYGLRRYDSANRTFDIYLRPYYTEIKVLSVPSLTIAGIIDARARKPLVPGKRSNTNTSSYALVNDANGRQLTGFYEFIDAVDCENSSAPNFRTFLNGKMFVISKKSLKSQIQCTYAGQQAYGVRRVYLGGYINAEKNKEENAALEDPDFLDAMGLATDRVIQSYALKNGEWKLMLRSGEVIKPSIAKENKIRFMSAFDYGYAIVVLSDGKCGVIDSNGNTHIDATYDYIKFSPDIPGYFYCGIRSNKYGLANQYGELVQTPKFNSIAVMGDVFYGKIKDSCFLFTGEEEVQIGRSARPSKFEGTVGFIKTRQGYQITRDMGATTENGSYKSVRPFHHGYAPVSKAGLWGLVDANGNAIIKQKYTNAREFGFTAGVFEQRHKWVFIDLDGKKLPGPKGAEAHQEIAPGIFVYTNKNGKFGVFNAEGKKIASFRFSECPIYANNHVIGSKNSRVYFFTPEGGKDGNLPAVSRERNKQFTHERAGKPKLNAYAGYHVLQFAPAQLKVFGSDTPWSVLNIPLAIRLGAELQKDYLYEAYKNDVFLVKRGYYQFVNGNDELLIPQRLLAAKPMQNGLSVCKTLEAKWGVLDKQGFWVVPPEYSDIKRLNDSIFAYRVAWEFDVFDATGEKITDHKADVLRFHNGVLTMQQENRIGYYKPGTGMIWQLQE